MSYPNPAHDPENVYPDDNYKPVAKKKAMARKMSPIDKLKELIKESEGLRHKPFNPKRSLGKRTPVWFKGGQGGGGLPPGRKDQDNE